MNDPKPMKGWNTLSLCQTEMKVAMQEYVDRRFGQYAPEVEKVWEITKEAGTFQIFLKERNET